METVLRVAIVYVVLMAALRVMGKREFGQLSPFEFVTLLLIPELLQQGLVRDDFSLTNGIVALSTLLTLVFLTSLVSFMSQRFETAIAGKPTVLVRHGYLVPETMAPERVAPDEILNEMHKMGLERMDQVKWAVLETDGRVTFVPWIRGGEGKPPESKQAE